MPSASATPVVYDFRRPNKFTREHVRALQIASETFARQFTTVLSTTLRTVSQVQAKGIHQLTYDEYIRDVGIEHEPRRPVETYRRRGALPCRRQTRQLIGTIGRRERHRSQRLAGGVCVPLAGRQQLSGSGGIF